MNDLRLGHGKDSGLLDLDSGGVAKIAVVFGSLVEDLRKVSSGRPVD